MTEAELAVVTILASSVGGALGARNAEAQAWKGFVIIAVATIVTFIILTVLNVDNVVLGTICNVIIAGVVGAILKMSARQTSIVIVGAILVAAIAGALIGYIG